MGRPIVRRRARASGVAAAAITILAACTASTGTPDGRHDRPGVAPIVSVPPASAIVTEGEPASFTVTAQGTAPLAYQWQRNGTAIAGATGTTYAISQTALSDSGAQLRVVVSNAAGSVTSEAASLTVNPASADAPAITTPLANQVVNVGQAATFTVVARGSGLSYAWRRNGTAIPGAASAASYTTPAAVAGDDGAVFGVVVSNARGSVTSSAALTVRVPPSITTPPASVTVSAGRTATFSVVAAGTAPLSYQWQRDGTAIAGATAATYTTAATVADDSGATFRVVVSNAVGSVTSSAATLTVGTPGDGSMTTASRTSGVAPLAVFFDAVDDVERGPGVNGSTFAWSSGVFQPADYEGTQYDWDFGDPGSGTWATGTPNRSRNTATGYTAAHVYESPGSYTARLTVTDATGTVRTYTQAITVSDFSGTTFYVAVTGRDSNDGRSPSTAFRSVDQAMTTALATSGPVRVLFNRGDTFGVIRAYEITKEGPGIIGAYGTGDRPVLSIEDLGETNVFLPYGTGRDWRFMDLDMVGPSTTTLTGPIGPPNTIQAVQMLVLRVRARNWKVGIGWADWEPIFATPHDEMALVECEVTGAQLCAYPGGRRLMLLGNDFRDGGNTHVLRVWQAHKAVISNNNLLRPHAQRHCLKLHGPSVSGPDSDHGLRIACPATRWVTISDNNVEASTQSQWSISIGPQDSINDERISHVVYERNRHAGSPSLVAEIESSASAVMVRNNVFDGTPADGYTGVLYMQRGIEPAPDDVRIYGNTFHKGGANSGTIGFDIGPAVTRCRIRNNLFSYGSGSATLVQGGTGAGFAADHNLLTTTPGFVAGGFSLSPGSPAVDAGASLTELREDHVRAARPAGAGHDIGAYESH